MVKETQGQKPHKIIGNLFIWKNKNKNGLYYTFSKLGKDQKYTKIYITETEYKKLTGE